MSATLAWHFLADRDGVPVLRTGDPLVIGKWYEHDGELELCASGLHASVLALDALSYAPGPWVSLVECAGEVQFGDDKLVCTRRRALWVRDATEELRLFARLCALDVIHMWDAPTVVREYLETGDEALSAAAWAAAWAAARDAAWDAARASARAAARDAAWAAARDAAWDATKDAARDALRHTVEMVQVSAFDLLERMLDPGGLHDVPREEELFEMHGRQRLLPA
jgi:hypothetical protein